MADEISEQQLLLLKDNIKQALFSYLINHYDTKYDSLSEPFHIIIRKSNTNVDYKIQHAVLHSHIQLQEFANYFAKGLEIQITQGKVILKTANLRHQLFTYLGPPIPWKFPMSSLYFHFSKHSQGEIDKLYRKERNFKRINLSYFNKPSFPMNSLPYTIEYFVHFLITWP